MLDDLVSNFQRLSASLQPDDWDAGSVGETPTFYLRREESGIFELRALDKPGSTFEGLNGIHKEQSRAITEKQGLLSEVVEEQDGKVERPELLEPPGKRASWKGIFSRRRCIVLNAKARLRGVSGSKPVLQHVKVRILRSRTCGRRNREMGRNATAQPLL